MTLRARTTRGALRNDDAGPSSNHVGALSEERPRRVLSLAVKVLIVAAVIIINLLIYANLQYFKMDASSFQEQ
ncbi:uncharacterized protein LOC144096665 isoform X2 [Amblyomma americanum]|uniref:Uncharacterized protein n=1 Tax=Amblyomma americanum TaxID=6943 RepID=A0AAQ4DWH9_AMBAM